MYLFIGAISFDEFYELMYSVHQGKSVVFCPPLIDMLEDIFDDVNDVDVEDRYGFEVERKQDITIERSSTMSEGKDTNKRSYK